ncbi:MAG: TIGR01777 family protein [Deltaproteobacteria bacterium]|nr:TIGR01777 family protein [Deltaproteobacteria bacterium]
MRVAITGATGFVGRALVDGLTSEGHHVLAFVRDRARARELIPRAELIELGELLGGPISSCDAWVNLAGAPLMEGRWTEARRAELARSRVDLTERIVLSLPRSESLPLRTIVSASAVGFYGDRGDEWLDESADPGSDFLSQLCVRWEGAAQKARALGIRVVTLRIGIVLEAGGGMLGKLAPIFRACLGGRIGSGKQFVSWIHRADLLSVVDAALNRFELSGPINAVAPNPVRNSELTQALGRALHRPTLFPVPRFALELALGDSSFALLSSQRVQPRRLLESGFSFAHPELPEALHAVFETR